MYYLRHATPASTQAETDDYGFSPLHFAVASSDEGFIEAMVREMSQGQRADARAADVRDFAGSARIQQHLEDCLDGKRDLKRAAAELPVKGPPPSKKKRRGVCVLFIIIFLFYFPRTHDVFYLPTGLGCRKGH